MVWETRWCSLIGSWSRDRYEGQVSTTKSHLCTGLSFKHWSILSQGLVRDSNNSSRSCRHLLRFLQFPGTSQFNSPLHYHTILFVFCPLHCQTEAKCIKGTSYSASDLQPTEHWISLVLDNLHPLGFCKHPNSITHTFFLTTPCPLLHCFFPASLTSAHHPHTSPIRSHLPIVTIYSPYHPHVTFLSPSDWPIAQNSSIRELDDCIYQFWHWFPTIKLKDLHSTQWCLLPDGSKVSFNFYYFSRYGKSCKGWIDCQCWWVFRHTVGVIRALLETVKQPQSLFFLRCSTEYHAYKFKNVQRQDFNIISVLLLYMLILFCLLPGGGVASLFCSQLIIVSAYRWHDADGTQTCNLTCRNNKYLFACCSQKPERIKQLSMEQDLFSDWLWNMFYHSILPMNALLTRSVTHLATFFIFFP